MYNVVVDPPKSKEEALLALMDRTGYNIIQENGQRKYGPPPNWKGTYPPPKGCEVFVGKLPRDLYEDELVPAFETIGQIYEMRLMMDFSGTNRGFAFVMYTSPDDAKKAITVLNNYEIRKGKIIGVCKSVDNCRLFVGGIPKNKACEEIKVEMQKVTEGVVDVILYSSVHDKTKNRGFAFVEYENHRSAAMARRKLIPGKIQLWGHEIAVDWAEPEPEVDEDTMSKVTVLYVRNLMPETTEDQIRETFTLNGNLKVEKVKKLRDFAFVHFSVRQDAETAKEKFHGSVLGGSIVDVSWAKPADRVNRRTTNNRGNALVPMVTSYSTGPIVYGPGPTGYDMIGYGPSYGFAPGSMQSPNGTSGGMILPRIAIRGRSSRGAAGMRGLRGGHSYNSNNNRNTTSVRRQTEVLQDVCTKNNWGEPLYTLHSTVHPEMGDNIQLFLYKVSIPGLPSQYNQFQPPKVCQYMDEAKQFAAQFVLSQLGVPLDGPESSPIVNMPPSCGSPNGPYNNVGYIRGPPPSAGITDNYRNLWIPQTKAPEHGSSESAPRKGSFSSYTLFKSSSGYQNAPSPSSDACQSFEPGFYHDQLPPVPIY